MKWVLGHKGIGLCVYAQYLRINFGFFDKHFGIHGQQDFADFFSGIGTLTNLHHKEGFVDFLILGT